MRIGIDCRLWNESGVGRYTRNLVLSLDKYDKSNEYVLFLLSRDLNDNRLPKGFKKVASDVRWHTVSEQILMLKIFLKENLDLLHVPYVSLPLFYPKRFVVTVHDLIPIKFPVGAASKLPLSLYVLKVVLYYFVLFIGLRRASKVVAVSKSTRDDIVKYFRVNADKIAVIYNALEEGFGEGVVKPAEAKNYILYVGNAYPHKNLDRLINAYNLLDLKIKNCPYLFLVGRKDVFYNQLESRIPDRIKDKVKFLGFVPDIELMKYYAESVALILPSLGEGFGFPILEAFSCGTLVVCSDISPFKEVAGECAAYFNPYDVNDICSKLSYYINLNETERANILKRYANILGKFSWGNGVKAMMSLYESIFNKGVSL